MPTALPIPKKRGRPFAPRDENGNIIRNGVSNAKQGTSDGIAAQSGGIEKVAAEVRPLPEDPGELEKATRRYRMMSKPIVQGMSHLVEAIGSDPFEKDESESLEFAGAACMYSYFPVLDAKWMLAAALIGIATPRLAKLAADSRRESKKALHSGMPGRIDAASVVRVMAEEKAQDYPMPVGG